MACPSAGPRTCVCGVGAEVGREGATSADEAERSEASRCAAGLVLVVSN